MNRIRTHLDYMTKSLEKADKENSNDSVWVTRVRQTAFMIEEVVEEFVLDMILAELDKPSNFCRLRSCSAITVCFFKQAVVQFQFHQQLKKICNRLDTLKVKSDYEIPSTRQEGKMKTDMSYAGQASYFVEDLEVVGIDEEVAELENLVNKRNKEEHMVVITVWGVDGSGKTALVKQVYKNIQKDSSMECHAWVLVSGTNVEAILRKMMVAFYKSLKEDPPNFIQSKDVSVLGELLHNYLQHKRYVLILDDVWDSKVLENIMFALPQHNMSSIIITSCDKKIASNSGMGGKHHHLWVKPLDDKLAWELSEILTPKESVLTTWRRREKKLLIAAKTCLLQL